MFTLLPYSIIQLVHHSKRLGSGIPDKFPTPSHSWDYILVCFYLSLCFWLFSLKLASLLSSRWALYLDMVAKICALGKRKTQQEERKASLVCLANLSHT